MGTGGTYSASISTALGDHEGANQVVGTATDDTHTYSEPSGPCSVGCTRSLDSELVIGQDG